MVAVTEAEPLEGHQLRLRFDDGSERVVDLAGVLWGEMGEPLRDPEYFRQVRVDPELRTVVWPNGFDLDPDVLHGDYDPLRAANRGTQSRPARNDAPAAGRGVADLPTDVVDGLSVRSCSITNEGLESALRPRMSDLKLPGDIINTASGTFVGSGRNVERLDRRHGRREP